MSLPFWRTGLVDISDGELIVLDALADCGALRFGHLVNDEFDLRFNCDSPGLDDSALKRLLTRWRRFAWIRPVVADDGERFELTPLGGLHWERERQPDWSRFAFMEERPVILRENRHASIFRYVGVRRFQVDALHSTWSALSPISARKARCVRTTRARDSRQSWKALDALEAICEVAEVHPENGRASPDWSEYESRRSWWSSTGTLMEWRGKPP